MTDMDSQAQVDNSSAVLEMIDSVRFKQNSSLQEFEQPVDLQLRPLAPDVQSTLDRDKGEMTHGAPSHTVTSMSKPDLPHTPLPQNEQDRCVQEFLPKYAMREAHLSSGKRGHNYENETLNDLASSNSGYITAEDTAVYGERYENQFSYKDLPLTVIDLGTNDKLQ